MRRENDRRQDRRSGSNRFGDDGNDNFRSDFRQSRPRRFDSGPREMHKAVCSECGNECEVPFEPTPGKAVYCKECFAKHRPPRRF